MLYQQQFTISVALVRDLSKPRNKPRSAIIDRLWAVLAPLLSEGG